MDAIDGWAGRKTLDAGRGPAPIRPGGLPFGDEARPAREAGAGGDAGGRGTLTERANESFARIRDVLSDARLDDRTAMARALVEVEALTRELPTRAMSRDTLGALENLRGHLTRTYWAPPTARHLARTQLYVIMARYHQSPITEPYWTVGGQAR